MITGIKIKNFKGIGDPGISIDLAPVTLLFGVNNAGKSSVFHAFMLADELFNRGNRNPSRIGPEGSSIDLGGFESFVNDQVVSKPIELVFSLDFSSTKFDREWPIEESLGQIGPTDGRGSKEDWTTVGDDVWDGEVKIVLCYDPAEKKPFVQSYGIKLNGESLGELRCERIRDGVRATRINTAHPLLRLQSDRTAGLRAESFGVVDDVLQSLRDTSAEFYRCASARSPSALPIDDGAPLLQFFTASGFDDYEGIRMWEPVDSESDDDVAFQFAEFEQIASDLGEGAIYPSAFYFGRRPDGRIELCCIQWEADEHSNELGENGFRDIARDWFDHFNQQWDIVRVNGQADAIPAWNRPLDLKFPSNTWSDYSEDDKPIRLTEAILTRLIVIPGRILAGELAAFRHIGPLRRTPDRSFRLATFSDRFRWSDGLAAWDALLKSRDLSRKVSDWVQREDRLGLGYEIDFQEFREVPVDSPITRCFMDADEVSLDTLQMAAELFEALPVRTQVRFRPENSTVFLQPQDLAVGLNQVLPVVVAALDDHEGLTFIEQPELHNHPSVEVGLGDLFAQSAKSNKGRFILETHGEHLTLRLLRRIRQTNDGELPEGVPPLCPEEIAIYFIDRNAESAHAKRLRIDKSGEFIDSWPGGFFNERAEELFG